MITQPTPHFVEAIERVTGEILGYSFPPNTEYILSIPLGRNDYTHGDLTMFLPNVSDVTYSRRRRSGYYKFGRANDEAAGTGPELNAYTISLCVFYDRWQGGYAFRKDSKLSSGRFSSRSSKIELLTIVIDGSDLKLTFKNTSTTYTDKLNIVVTADCWKATL